MGACQSSCCDCYCELQGRLLLLFIGYERQLPPSSASCHDSGLAAPPLAVTPLKLALKPPERTENRGAPSSKETDFENPRARELQGLILRPNFSICMLPSVENASDSLLTEVWKQGTEELRGEHPKNWSSPPVRALEYPFSNSPSP